MAQDGMPRLGDDLLLFDRMTDFPLPRGASRTDDIIVGLCLEGESKYTANAVEHAVGPGDVLMIHDGQVVDDYVASPGQKGVGLMMSPGFFHEVLKDIHELSALIIFSRSFPVFRLTPREVDIMTAYYRLIKEKVEDEANGLRRDVARHIIAAMVCELSNAIRRIPYFNGEKQMRAEKDFRRLHSPRGAELQDGKARRVVWTPDVHHAEIPLGDGEDREPPHAQRVDRQLCDHGAARTACATPPKASRK